MTTYYYATHVCAVSMCGFAQEKSFSHDTCSSGHEKNRDILVSGSLHGACSEGVHCIA